MVSSIVISALLVAYLVHARGELLVECQACLIVIFQILMYQILSRNLADSHHIKKSPGSQNQFSASVIEETSKDRHFTSEGQMNGTRVRIIIV